MGTAKSTNEAAREKLHDIIEQAQTVLLLTHGDDRRIGGRPMSVVRVDDDSAIYLVANIDSKEVSEVLIDPRVAIAFQNREAIAMIDGEATVSGDRTLIDELWSDRWKTWFPQGKDDPAIAIVIVQPREGTYWDQDVGHGLSYVYRYLKARVTGVEMPIVHSDRKRVDLGRRHH